MAKVLCKNRAISLTLTIIKIQKKRKKKKTTVLRIIKISTAAITIPTTTNKKLFCSANIRIKKKSKKFKVQILSVKKQNHYVLPSQYLSLVPSVKQKWSEPLLEQVRLSVLYRQDVVRLVLLKIQPR